jgi:hypothetical protein
MKASGFTLQWVTLRLRTAATMEAGDLANCATLFTSLLMGPLETLEHKPVAAPEDVLAAHHVEQVHHAWYAGRLDHGVQLAQWMLLRLAARSNLAPLMSWNLPRSVTSFALFGADGCARGQPQRCQCR